MSGQTHLRLARPEGRMVPGGRREGEDAAASPVFESPPRRQPLHCVFSRYSACTGRFLISTFMLLSLFSLFIDSSSTYG